MRRRCTGLRLLPGIGLAVIASTWNVLPARAQDEESRFQRVESEAGLSHNSVYAITQDTEGFLWIGTVDGLNRYDGYEFRVYRHDPQDSTTLSNNLIHDLLPDRAGRLWVATDNGLNRLDQDHNGFVRYILRSEPERLESRRIHDLHQDSTGSLWVASDIGLFRYSSAEDRFVAFNLEGDAPGRPRSVHQIQHDGAGNLWLLADDGIGPGALQKFAPETATFEPFDVSADWEAVYTFLIDGTGGFWLDPGGPGVLAEFSRRLTPQTPGGAGPAAWAFLQTRDASVWIGTEEGVHVFDPSSKRRTHHLVDDTPDSYLGNFVRALFEDRSGTVWVGTHAGLYRWDPNAKPFQHLAARPRASTTLSSSAISSIDVESVATGSLWLGTYGGGLNRLEGSRVTHYRHRPGDTSSLRDDVVWDIHWARNRVLWVGTDAGLCSFDPTSSRFTWHDLPLPVGQESQSYVRFIAEDTEGQLWLTGAYGVYRHDPASGASRLYEPEADDLGLSGILTESVLVDGEVVWIGLGSGNLSKLELATGRFTHYPLVSEDGHKLESEGVWDLHRSEDGTLWLGTGTGLSRFDPEGETFVHYFQRDGLPGSVVYSILEDDAGRLWLGTNAGLSRFDPRLPPNGEFRNFNVADGVGSAEFNRHAAFKSRNGRFFFGGMDGVTSFFPNAIKDNPYVPPVVFTSVQTSNRDSVTLHNSRGVEHIVLSYRDYSLSFEFAALSFTNPSQNRYAYLLEGFDDDWVETGGRRFAQYTNLPPGDYTLRVRGSNNDGVWNEDGISLRLTVTPPFWQRWWFRALLAFLFFAGLAAAYRYRVGKLLEIERLRLRIAGDLHDDLSSNLSGIALMSEMVQRQDSLGHAERRQLTRITETARGMVEDVRDLVWLVDPTHEQLDELLLKMKDVASTLLDRIPYEFRSNIERLSDTLSLDFRRHVFLVYKEILHNIARHSHATSVAITAERVDRQFVLRVDDNGVGFEYEGVRTSHGLGSIEQRARQMGGRVTIESTVGRGTRVELRVPLA